MALIFLSLTVLSKLDLVPELGPALGQALPNVPLIHLLLAASATIQIPVPLLK